MKTLFKFDFGYVKIPFNQLAIGDDFTYITGEGKLTKTSKGLGKVKVPFRGQKIGAIHQVSLQTQVLIKTERNIFSAVWSLLISKIFNR